MDLLTIFLLILIYADFTGSKSIMYNRRNKNSQQINSKESETTILINSLAQTNSATENPKSQIRSITKNNFVDQNNLNLIDSTPIGSVRRLDPSEQLHINQINSVSIPKKQATRQKYITNDEVTSMRTTSEDTLRWLLSKKLPFPDPAPNQIGQTEKGIMYPVTVPLWTFEGYDDTYSVNERVRDDYSDCEGQRIRCITDTDYNQPVCVTDNSMPDGLPLAARTKGFGSACEVEYRNCLKRYEISGKYYADNYSEDYLEFLHYGWCNQCNVVELCAG